MTCEHQILYSSHERSINLLLNPAIAEQPHISNLSQLHIPLRTGDAPLTRDVRAQCYLFLYLSC